MHPPPLTKLDGLPHANTVKSPIANEIFAAQGDFVLIDVLAMTAINPNERVNRLSPISLSPTGGSELPLGFVHVQNGANQHAQVRLAKLGCEQN
jgi:hypothetical protein